MIINAKKRDIVILLMFLQLTIIMYLAFNLFNVKRQNNDNCNVDNNDTLKNDTRNFRCYVQSNKYDNYLYELREDYEVNKDGLVIKHVISDVYSFYDKEKYMLSKDNFSSLENVDTLKDDNKMQIIQVREENIIDKKMWYLLINESLKDNGYTCIELEQL